VNLIGLEGEGIKEIAEAARIEDRNHFEALVPRIYELGGELPQDMKEFHDMSACPPAYLPEDLTDINAILTVLVEAERCAVPCGDIPNLQHDRWQDGRHQVLHAAGADLTASLDEAPHGVDLLARFPVIGMLSE